VNPYTPVTDNRRLLPDGWVCTALWYVTHRGLPADLGFRQQLGLFAARIARCHGLGQAKVWEDPFWVWQWPDWVWNEAAAQVPLPPAPPPVPLLPYGYTEAGDYG